ncbi:zinc finger BED domain-containing protein 4-like [Pecten maximus]|uniref:zinc finger BED domain-containing protein 4-like n=1 Tax=Pecten maximus TaxID=6579 RepID=UPI00145918D7|nr:zinc finger BED domain-containing protein 4-like [Pecten maximus]
MAERFLEQQSAMQATLYSPEMIKQSSNLPDITEADFTAAEHVVNIMKCMKTATVAMCEEKVPTVSVVSPLFNKLTKSFRETSANTTNNVAKEILDAYGDGSLEKVIVKVEKDDATRLLPSLQGSKDLDAHDEETTPVPPVSPNKSSPAKKKPKCETACALDDLLGDVFITNVEPATKSHREQVKDEINKYRNKQGVKMSGNPLEWWKSNETELPSMSRLAKRYLGAPATSVPAERVFSTAGDIVTAQRSGLKPSSVDALIF